MGTSNSLSVERRVTRAAAFGARVRHLASLAEALAAEAEAEMVAVHLHRAVEAAAVVVAAVAAVVPHRPAAGLVEVPVRSRVEEQLAAAINPRLLYRGAVDDQVVVPRLQGQD